MISNNIQVSPIKQRDATRYWNGNFAIYGVIQPLNNNSLSTHSSHCFSINSPDIYFIRISICIITTFPAGIELFCKFLMV